MSSLVYLHGVLKKIVSDRGTQFTLKFWDRLHETLDTNCTLVLLITLRSMVRSRESIIFLWVCGELMLYNTEEVGLRVCRMPSSPTTIVIKKVLRWHRLRCYIFVGAEPCCYGVRLENKSFWTQHTARSREAI
jgi:hypothetical protein